MEEKGKKSPFNKKQVTLAVAALNAHLKDEKVQKKGKDVLFKSDDLLWLMVGLKKVPNAEKKPRKLPVPHTFTSDSDVCLISKDTGKEIKKKLLEDGITSISKVISLTKLRKQYKTFELKRQLASSHDIFLCDDRIYHLVVKTLGKEFFKRKKEPIPIRLTYKNWKEEIHKSVDCALLRLGHGPCSAVKVGSISQQSEKELSENAIHLMQAIGDTIPGKWKNIKCFHLKTSTSVALPVYQSSPLSDISMEKLREEPKTTDISMEKLQEEPKTTKEEIVAT